MNHLDLFSGIGGFAYAVDQVWPGSTHTFCDNNLFCQKVLAKHWPESLIYGDIRTITDTEYQRWGRMGNTSRQGNQNKTRGENKWDLLTGGFPCQPFSQAGKRRGTADDRIERDRLLRENGHDIIGLCNGDATESVQGAEYDPERERAEGIANHATRNTKQSGEQETWNDGEQPTRTGQGNENTRYTTGTGGSASVAERQTKPSSQSTTSTEGGMWNGDSTTPRPGNWSSRTDTQRPIKSSATTATTPNTTSENVLTSIGPVDILTGGFPCQPFSQAGKRRGTDDERYLWPEMLRVIQLTNPTWIIGENVGGFVTWNEGMVLEQVCTDLEAEGYEVQPFIIPAVSVNAPHRRDRVWIIAHRQNNRSNGGTEKQRRQKENQQKWQNLRDKFSGENSGPDWEQNWFEVATELCGVDDGLPVELDGLKLSKAQNRAEQLKAYGNAIVPQVAIQIMKAIKSISKLSIK